MNNRTYIFSKRLMNNLLIATGLMILLLLMAFLTSFYWEANRDYKTKEDSIIAYTEAGIRNIKEEFEDAIRGIKRLDLFITSVVAKESSQEESLQRIGNATAAVFPNLHGIIKTDGKEILDYYAHTGNKHVFERGLQDFLVDYTDNSNVHFFSVKYSNTSKSLEAAHRVSTAQCEYIFVYELNNSYIWEDETPVNSLRNSFYIYDIGLDTIIPRTMAYISTSQMKDELGKGLQEGYFTANISGYKQIIVYEKCGSFDCYIFSSAQMDTFSDYLKKFIADRSWILGLITALLTCLFIAVWTVVIRPLCKTEDMLYKGLLKGERLPEKSAGPSLVSPLTNSVYVAKERLEGIEKQNYRERFLKEEAKIITLQSQINPHFMYNTLESVRALAMVEGAREASKMTKALANYFRYTINKGDSIVALHEELANVENYMTIQNYRFQNRFFYAKEYNESDTVLMESRICKMTLQPIVENAVFHGLEPKRGNGRLTIQIFQTQKNLIIMVKDDGVGIAKEQLMQINDRFVHPEEYRGDLPKHGIALTNVNQRIKLYFGMDYGLYLYSKEGAGTEAEITLPLVAANKDVVQKDWLSSEGE